MVIMQLYLAQRPVSLNFARIGAAHVMGDPPPSTKSHLKVIL
jgi:hypothetical protein